MTLGRRLLLLAVVACSCAVASAQDDCPPDDYCRAAPGAPVCGGRGRCECGYCECDQGVSGQYCECDDSSCPYSAGRLCGGPDSGVCRCGRCQCAAGWMGDACDCPTSTATCMQPGSDRICSNKGSCECGQCRCVEYGGESYSGHYCETCPTCVGKCVTYRHCIECLAFKSGPLKDNCQEGCSAVRIALVDNATAAAASDRLCSFFTSEGCRYNFVYGSGSTIRVAKRMQCPQAAPGLTAPSREKEGGAGSAAAASSVLITVLAVVFATWW